MTKTHTIHFKGEIREIAFGYGLSVEQFASNCFVLLAAGSSHTLQPEEGEIDRVRLRGAEEGKKGPLIVITEAWKVLEHVRPLEQIYALLTKRTTEAPTHVAEAPRSTFWLWCYQQGYINQREYDIISAAEQMSGMWDQQEG